MMKKKIIAFNEKCLMIYVVVFALWSLVGRIIPIYLFLGIKAGGYAYIFLALAGGILILGDFLTERYMFKTRYCKYLYMFIAALIVSCLININRGYIDNTKTVIWTIIQMAGLYPVYLRIKDENYENLIKVVFSIISVVWTVGVLYSFKQFVLTEAYDIEIGVNMIKRQGFQYGRLFGIFNDPNFAGVMSVYVIAMICYLILDKKWAYKIIGGFIILIQQTYVILSGSRTALICELVTGVFIVIIVGRFLYKEDNQIKRIVKVLVLCVAFICLLGLVFSGGRKILGEIPIYYSDKIDKKSQENINSSQSVEADVLVDKQSHDAIEEEPVLADRSEEKMLSNNRFIIWKEYIRGMKGKYLFGLSPRNMLSYYKENGTSSYLTETNYETHNGYVSVFVGTGMLGTFFMVCFIIQSIKFVWKVCFVTYQFDGKYLCMLSILCILIIYSFFFTELFFVNNLTTVLFWLILGRILCKEYE